MRLIKCSLCESTQFKKFGKTANGYQKYWCEVCNTILIDGADKSLFSPEINFLRFKKKHLIQHKTVRAKINLNFDIETNQELHASNESIKSSVFRTLINVPSNVHFFVSNTIASINNCNRKVCSGFRDRENPRFLDSAIGKFFYRFGSIIFCVAIVFGISYSVNGNLEERYFPMFYPQAEAFLQGRVNIIGDSKLDLIPFDNQYFLAIPPLNAFLILPFVYFFKEKFTETWFANILYSLLIVIQYIYVEKFAVTKNIWQRGLLFIFLALGTMILPCAVIATSWFNALLGSCIFLSLAWITLYFAKNLKQDILAITCLAIAAIGRFHLALILPIFIIKAWRERHLKCFWKLLALSVPAILFVIFVLWWNWARFGNVFSFKYEDLVYADFFGQNIKKYGFRNIVYILPNIYHGILAFPKLIPQFPFFKIDDIGNGILAISPLFIYILFAKRQRNFFNKFAWLCMAIIAIPVFTHCSTGWRQFGYRYFLDFFPFATFLLLQTKINLIRPLPFFCIFLSLWFNIFGSIMFLKPEKFGM
jgi:hypothetical protein